MDNLTHSLIGALIGQTGLKKLSGLGMPTLIIAANIPDIDAACFLWLEGTEHLGFRRGITHGPLAMLLLPLLLTAAVVGFDWWQARRGKRPPGRAAVRAGPLFLLALIGTLSHPAFDWLNNYGVRLLEPFSSRWFYGDSIFIIDVWMWVILIGGLVWSWRAERRDGRWRRAASIAGALLLGYIALNIRISRSATASVAAVTCMNGGRDQSCGIITTVASAPPLGLAFTYRDVYWRTADKVGWMQYAWPYGVQDIEEWGSIGMDDPRIAAAERTDSQVRAFLFWARLPFAVQEADGSITIKDQRFTHSLAEDRFKVRIAPENSPR